MAENRSRLIAVWPWKAERYKLWSLLDMMKFEFEQVANLLILIERMVALTRNVESLKEVELRAVLKESVDALKRSKGDVPLSPAMNTILDHLAERSATESLEVLRVLIRDAYEVFLKELGSHLFLCVDAANRSKYEQKEPVFGLEVLRAFPSATKDIEAAARCFAVDEWTACVFHLMRTLEHGLRSLSGMVNLPADAMEQENWGNVIDQIEKKIRELKNDPKSPAKTQKLQIYSEAAAQFRYFKDAWRNHVSHSRVTYDPRDAESVWNHVKEFMQHMATV
jgi:hypothetical protein